MSTYVGGLIAAKRAEPADDLITALTQVHDEDGDRLTEPELVINIQTLIVAGFRTTMGQFSNSIVALSRNPDQFDPNRFDIMRPNANQHLTFTYGAHSCLGVYLARTELRVAMEALLGRFPTLRSPWPTPISAGRTPGSAGHSLNCRSPGDLDLPAPVATFGLPREVPRATAVCAAPAG